MPLPYRIVDLDALGQLPVGNELAEISLNGAGSRQVPIAVLAAGRAAQIISTGGTTTLSGTSYGDVLITTTSAVTIQLPQASTRAGVPIGIIAQQTTTPNITILPFAGETIVGLTSLTITSAYGSFNLWPVPTGGWYQK